MSTELISGYARDTIVAALKRAVAAWGDAVWLQFGEASYSFAEVDLASNRLANGLATLGVKRGDTVVTMLDTSVDMILCWLAINKLGAIWTPLNTAYRGEFLRHQVDDSQAEIVICEDHYINLIFQVAEGLPAVRTLLHRGDGADHPRFRIIPLDDVRKGDDAAPSEMIDADDLTCLLYTSGTTGPSRGCMISHNYMCNVGRQTNRCVVMAPGEAAWTCLPLFHIGAAGYFLMGTLLAGNRACFSPRFSVTTFWDEIEATGAVTAALMSTMFPLLAQAPDTPAMQRCFGQLRVVTGIPVTEAVRKVWLERFGTPYVNSYTYGQTEGGKYSHHWPDDPLPPPGSAGRAAQEFELCILDEHDLALPAGQIGEIAVRPKRPGIMFSGYWRLPEETNRVWRIFWMHTGDIGRMDDQGNLFFVDRKKDYLRARGENISSFEVETLLASHPGISEVVVYQVDDDVGLGEAIKISAVPLPGYALTEEALWQWSVPQLPHFAVARFIEFHESLPKTPTGKIQKFELRNQPRSGKAWDAVAAGYDLRRQALEQQSRRTADLAAIGLPAAD